VSDFTDTSQSDVVMRNYIRRVRDSNEMAEQWKIDHRNAMFAYEVEFFINDWIGIAAQVQAIADRFRRLASADQVKDYFSETAAVLMMIQTTRKNCRVGRDLAAQAQGQGYTVRRSDDLEDAIDGLECLNDDVRESWPTIDEATLDLSRMNYEAGNSQTAEEILNELQGSGSSQHTGKDRKLGPPG
jgi:hypothetical protein